jgi:hypothetical protein
LAINVIDNSLRQYGSGGWMPPWSTPTSLSVNIYPPPAGLNFWVNGSVGWHVVGVTATGGANGLVNIGNASSIYLTGASAAFSIGGFTGGADGRVLTLMNATGQALTINHLDATVASGSRIFVPAQVNAALNPYASATFQWAPTSGTWWLMSAH